jgi:hypothetical protein
MSENPIKTKRAVQVTYGLLYPAFLGNMIYDIIQAKIDPQAKTTLEHLGFLQGLDWWIGLILIVYLIVDYMHLYTDMDATNPKGGPKKTTIFIVCDIATSFLFFGSFVALKYHELGWSIGFLAVIPTCTAIYKWELLKSGTELWVTSIYGVISIAMIIPIWFRMIAIDAHYLAAGTMVLFCYYFMYVFVLYKREDK